MASPCRLAWRIPPRISPRPLTSPSANSRKLTSGAASWHAQTGHASSRVQIYTSRSHDPYLNLSAEHFLLQNSHPDSTVLFLYVNDPCVVIGRNQNPWVEVNLGLLPRFQGRARDGGGATEEEVVGLEEEETTTTTTTTTTPTTTTGASLVRRRSGGGTVFHDRGNVNYSVICPPASFDRDRHAEMVVRALRRLGVATARVNERHDIVISPAAAAAGMVERGGAGTFKVSGSAYKLTRLRSLHHGTCLLSSPNLSAVGPLLRSPAEPFVKARGVESVRSPIRNVGLTGEELVGAVAGEFVDMYGAPDVEATMGQCSDAPDFAHEQIQKGVQELMSPEWIYNQTPQFTFFTHPTEEDPRARPPFAYGVPDDFRATMTIRHGLIQQANFSDFDGNLIQGLDLHTIPDWRHVLKPDSTGSWFNHLFGKPE